MIWWESHKERDHQRDLDIGRRTILKWILEKYNGVLWTQFIWLRIGTWWALVNMVMNLQVPQNVGKFLSS
jgi:hypothetical protein